MPLLPASRAGRRRAAIGLTPLIDVVFILLVFFMLASSFVDWRAIELMAPAAASGGPASADLMVVEVNRDSLRLAGEAVALDGLGGRLGELLAVRPKLRVLVRAEAGVTLAAVVAVLDRLTAAGITDLTLARDRRG